VVRGMKKFAVESGFHYDPWQMDETTSKDERMWAMIAHLSAYAGHFVPFGHILGPLIVWILKKDEFPLVDDQGREALNCQISYSIYFIVAGLLIFVVIGIVILPIVWILDVVLVLVAAIKANDGVRYRYPAIIRFIN
jgi:hypothetical protein